MDEYDLNKAKHNNTIELEIEDRNWPSGFYLGDGSGGIFSKYPHLRRCGVALHYLDLDKKPSYNFWQPLPGDEQSNNKAEIFALDLVTKNLEPNAIAHFYTDSQITYNSFKKGKQSYHNYICS